MLRSLISRLQAFILANPKKVLGGSLVAVIISLVLASGVEFRTSRKELAPADDPDQQRLDRLVSEFTGSQALIACVEVAAGASRTPGELRRFADALAAEFRADPAVAHVFHRVEQDWLLTHGLYLVPRSTLAEVVARLREEQLPSALNGLAGFADLNRLVAGRIRKGLESASAPADQEAAVGLERLADLIRVERRFLADPSGFVEELRSGSPLVLLAGALGERVRDAYLQTRDGSVLFVVVSPRSKDDDLATLRELMASMRDRVHRLSQRMPGFRVQFTGTPAMTVEEMDFVRQDTLFTSLVAVIGVTVLTLLVFRWRSHAWLVLVALGVGLAMAFGAVRLELGYLNMLTSSFIPTLIGVGVAYGIHPLSEYELEGAHTRDPVAALRGAYHCTGAAVTVAAVTTAAAFFSILLMSFRGFAELGLIAGFGVLLCLLAAMITLPALIVVYGQWRSRRDRTPRSAAASAAVDRLWVERAANRVCRFPAATTATALLLTAAAGWAALGIGFNTNILDLLPADAESLRSLRRMTVDSDLSPLFNMVVADDLEALGEMRDRAMAEPSIRRFDSILQFLPMDPEASRREVRDLAELVDRVELAERAEPASRELLDDSLSDLESALDEAAESAFTAGLAELVGPLERARSAAEEARAVVGEAPAGVEAAWTRGQQELLQWARDLLELLRRAAASEPPTLESLPAEIRERFVTERGQYIGFLYPVGNVFDPADLDPYIQASRRVAPDTTGYPLMFHLMSARITSGFYRAVIAGLVFVVLILLVDYRNVRDATLAMIPLVIGTIWMMGGMRVFGISFNFANLVGVPLIIGVGIDNGVHIIHRVRLEGERGMSTVLRHTGRAILIASLTTMIGFGSLSLASHRGLASLGGVLLLGVGSCLVASTIVLPNVLVALGLVRR